TSLTTPMGSWPTTSPGSMNGVNGSYRCRSEPHSPVEVIRTTASVGSSMRGSGTSVTCMSRRPCQVTAFMGSPRARGPGPAPGTPNRARSPTRAVGGWARASLPSHPRGRATADTRRSIAQEGGRNRLSRDRAPGTDRKSTRLNSSHVKSSYAVFCLHEKRLDHLDGGADGLLVL